MPRNNKWFIEPTAIYTFVLAGTICGFIVLEPVYPEIMGAFAKWIPILGDFKFLSPDSRDFMNNFIQWFGVLYGFLLPLLMVHAWEQFDKIDREFDREAETIKIFYDDIRFSRIIKSASKVKILNLLLEYVGHVKVHYPDESETNSREKEEGASILREVRGACHELADSELALAKEGEGLSSKLLDTLNKAVDVRGDRISLCNQRIFESLRFIAMVTSLIFALPFYFAQPRQPYAFVSTALVFGVFFLVIFLLTTIEDLDEPYTGIWKISNKPWLRLYDEISKSIEKLEPSPDVAEESLPIQKNTRPKKTRKASK